MYGHMAYGGPGCLHGRTLALHTDVYYSISVENLQVIRDKEEVLGEIRGPVTFSVKGNARKQDPLYAGGPKR